MQDLQRSLGLAYLFISHDLALVSHISDRVAVMYLGRIVELAPNRVLFSAPAHPYTRVLLSAVPDVDHPPDRKTALLGGQAASAIDPPPGCHFHPRCPRAREAGMPRRCQDEAPALHESTPGHFVACHLSG